jgi:exopolyphosphatase/guanosine-5'-triphosphate,3'-diphosphate pyrophosphatase
VRLATRFSTTPRTAPLSAQDRKLLQYAAILHDIGYHIAITITIVRLYLIKNSEMPGFTGDEIAMMATMVRYHRGRCQEISDARSR